MYLESKNSIYDAAAPTGRIHGSRNQPVDTGVALPTFISNNSLGKSVLFLPKTLGSSEIRVLVPKYRTLLSWDEERAPLVCKLHCFLGTLDGYQQSRWPLGGGGAAGAPMDACRRGWDFLISD